VVSATRFVSAIMLRCWKRFSSRIKGGKKASDQMVRMVNREELSHSNASDHSIKKHKRPVARRKKWPTTSPRRAHWFLLFGVCFLDLSEGPKGKEGHFWVL